MTISDRRTIHNMIHTTKMKDNITSPKKNPKTSRNENSDQDENSFIFDTDTQILSSSLTHIPFY